MIAHGAIANIAVQSATQRHNVKELPFSVHNAAKSTKLSHHGMHFPHIAHRNAAINPKGIELAHFTIFGNHELR